MKLSARAAHKWDMQEHENSSVISYEVVESAEPTIIAGCRLPVATPLKRPTANCGAPAATGPQATKWRQPTAHSQPF